ncbi:MAG: DUF4240 domain-containing protein [Saprospiraceae bacterium]
MTTLLEIPLREVSVSAIQALKSKYPEAMLRVEAENKIHSGSMDEAQFWAIINLLDWRTMNADSVISPAIEALSQFSKSDINAFHELLNEKLYTLDDRRFAEQLGSNRYPPDEGKNFSVDGFLYARCCVVANGKEFYEAVVADPTKMPKEYGFESLLYLPRQAWKLKTGQDDYDYFPKIWSETFSNPAGWPGMIPIKDRLVGLS